MVFCMVTISFETLRIFVIETMDLVEERISELYSSYRGRLVYYVVHRQIKEKNRDCRKLCLYLPSDQQFELCQVTSSQCV